MSQLLYLCICRHATQIFLSRATAAPSSRTPTLSKSLVSHLVSTYSWGSKHLKCIKSTELFPQTQTINLPKCYPVASFHRVMVPFIACTQSISNILHAEAILELQSNWLCAATPNHYLGEILKPTFSLTCWLLRRTIWRMLSSCKTEYKHIGIEGGPFNSHKV